MKENLLIVAGNLTRDPDLRYTTENRAVCNAGIAAPTPGHKDQNGKWVEGDPAFIDVAIWGPRAEAFAKAHKKGSPVYFRGYLKLDQWEDKATGQKRTKLKMVAQNWEFVGSRKARDEAPAGTDTGDTPF